MQVGTHDVALAVQVFAELINGQPTKLPLYDKAAYQGQGDRLPESAWLPVNQPGQPPIDVLMLEGWSVGFRPVSDDEVRRRWEAPNRTLHLHKLEHLLFVNQNLRAYDALTNLFHIFIHIDAQDTHYVYVWRAEQEEHLRLLKGGRHPTQPTHGHGPDDVSNQPLRNNRRAQKDKRASYSP